MAIKVEDVVREIKSALDCANGEYGGGYTYKEMEIKDNVLIIRPKDLKRVFKVKVEMFYE